MNTQNAERTANIRTSFNRQHKNVRCTDGRILPHSLISSKLFKMSFIIFAAIFFCVAGILNITAEGSEEPVEKQYKSIQIEEGDTLWSIAMEYNDVALSKNSTEDYIEEVLSINNLVRDDKIIAGNYLIVPVYVLDR